MPIAISRVGFPLMEPRIFVDLDGTLKTQYDRNEGKLSIEVCGKRWRFSKRPNADEFLSKLNKLGKVYLLTAAGRSYAQKVLAALNLESYFESIFAAENYAAGIPLYMNWVIIDDTEEIAVLKARSMGSNSMASDEDLKKRIVLVKSYSGRDDDKELLKAFDKVKKVVESE